MRICICNERFSANITTSAGRWINIKNFVFDQLWCMLFLSAKFGPPLKIYYIDSLYIFSEELTFGVGCGGQKLAKTWSETARQRAHMEVDNSSNPHLQHSTPDTYLLVLFSGRLIRMASR